MALSGELRDAKTTIGGCRAPPTKLGAPRSGPPDSQGRRGNLTIS